jgi:hypothetical protein
MEDSPVPLTAQNRQRIALLSKEVGYHAASQLAYGHPEEAAFTINMYANMLSRVARGDKPWTPSSHQDRGLEPGLETPILDPTDFISPKALKGVVKLIK